MRPPPLVKASAGGRIADLRPADRGPIFIVYMKTEAEIALLQRIGALNDSPACVVPVRVGGARDLICVMWRSS